MDYLTININDYNNICKHFYLVSWKGYRTNYYQVLFYINNKYYTKLLGRYKFYILKILLKIKSIIKKNIFN